MTWDCWSRVEWLSNPISPSRRIHPLVLGEPADPVPGCCCSCIGGQALQSALSYNWELSGSGPHELHRYLCAWDDFTLKCIWSVIFLPEQIFWQGNKFEMCLYKVYCYQLKFDVDICSSHIWLKIPAVCQRICSSSGHLWKYGWRWPL